VGITEDSFAFSIHLNLQAHLFYLMKHGLFFHPASFIIVFYNVPATATQKNYNSKEIGKYCSSTSFIPFVVLGDKKKNITR